MSGVQRDISPIVQVSLPRGLSGVKRRNVSSNSSLFFLPSWDLSGLSHPTTLWYLLPCKRWLIADLSPSTRAQTILWDFISQTETFCLLDDFRPLNRPFISPSHSQQIVYWQHCAMTPSSQERWPQAVPKKQAGTAQVGAARSKVCRGKRRGLIDFIYFCIQKWSSRLEDHQIKNAHANMGTVPLG